MIDEKFSKWISNASKSVSKTGQALVFSYSFVLSRRAGYLELLVFLPFPPDVSSPYHQKNKEEDWNSAKRKWDQGVQRTLSEGKGQGKPRGEKRKEVRRQKTDLVES
eukprot:6204967-Pleurochrysis_carterae.AAC.3